MDHSTRSSTEIIHDEYFDIGVAVQSFTLHTKGSNNNYGVKMIQKSGPIIWNNIPDNIQKAATINTFKFNLKKYFFSTI